MSRISICLTTAISSGRIISIRINIVASVLLVLFDKLFILFTWLGKVLVALPKECIFGASHEARALEQNAKVGGVILWTKLVGDFAKQLQLVMGQVLIVFVLSHG